VTAGNRTACITTQGKDKENPYRRADAPELQKEMHSVLVFHLLPADEVTQPQVAHAAIGREGAREIPVETSS
jgi:hypothetical protein